MSVDLRVDWCDHKAAEYAVMHWHYSKRMPQGRNNYIGVWENQKFIGSIIYGFSISPFLGHAFSLSQFQVTELKRVALNKHESPVTKMISASIKLLSQKNPDLRLIVSFADSEQAHIGGIYQAGNWIYVGSSTVEQVFIDGRWRNDTHANAEHRYKAKKTRTSLPKYKYLYPLDRAMRKQIAPLAKPYPKRETCGQSVEGDTSAPTEGESSILSGRSDSTGVWPVLIDTGNLQGNG